MSEKTIKGQKRIFVEGGRWRFNLLVSKNIMMFELIKESGKWKVVNFNLESPGASGCIMLEKLLNTYSEALEFLKKTDPNANETNEPATFHI